MLAKISNFQLASLFLLTRLFSECMDFPTDIVKYDMQRITTVITAKIILFIIFIPVLILCTKYPGENLFTIISAKSKKFGWVIFVIITACIMTGVIGCISRLEFFISNTIMTTASGWVLIALMSGVVIYGVFKGLEAVARFGSVMLFVFISILVLGTITLFSKMNFIHLYPSLIETPDTFFRDVIREIGKNNEIFIYAILCRNINQKPNRTIFMYIPALTFFVIYITVFFIVVFGSYIDIISFPFYALSSLMDLVIFDRLDGLDVTLWTVSAILKCILYLACIESMLLSLIKGKTAKFITIIITIFCSAGGIIITANRDLLVYIFNDTGFIAAALIIAIILPVVALIIKRGTKNDDNIKKKQIPAGNNTNFNLLD